jgi:hypothetical protein
VNDPTGKLASRVVSDTSIEAAFASNQAYSCGRKRSPTTAYAQPSSTGSPTTAASSRPAPPATASPMHEQARSRLSELAENAAGRLRQRKPSRSAEGAVPVRPPVLWLRHESIGRLRAGDRTVDHVTLVAVRGSTRPGRPGGPMLVRHTDGHRLPSPPRGQQPRRPPESGQARTSTWAARSMRPGGRRLVSGDTP